MPQDRGKTAAYLLHLLRRARVPVSIDGATLVAGCTGNQSIDRAVRVHAAQILALLRAERQPEHPG